MTVTIMPFIAIVVIDNIWKSIRLATASGHAEAVQYRTTLAHVTP